MRKSQKNPQSFKKLRKQAENLLGTGTNNTKTVNGKNIFDLLHELNVHQIELEMQNDELQRTMGELEESQNRYQELYEFAPVGYFTLDENNIIVEANLACNRLLNIERAQLLKKRFSRFVAKAYQDVFYAHRKEVLASKTKQACELELIKKDGSTFFAHLESIAAQNATETAGQLRMSIVDISARKQAEHELQASEEKFRSFVETTKEWVWAVDERGYYTYSNPSVQFILGYSPKELLGRSRLMLVHPEERLNALAVFTEHVKRRRGWNEAIWRWRHKDGSYRYLESGAAPVINNEGKLIGYRGTDRDITMRIKAENDLRQHQQTLNQAARTTSMGEMASALAHELTQPLTAINNFLTGCMRRLEIGNYQRQELIEAMRYAAQQAERAGAIIHRMKEFVQKGKLHFENVEVHTMIREALSFIKNELTEVTVKLQIQKSHNSISLKVDKIQIELVLLNLIRNSIEAMERSEMDEYKKELSIQTHVVDDYFVKISVRDTGVGFVNIDETKLFEPYFTTKPHGLGMGLAICRGIVEAHGGQLSARSLVQGGACFEIILPKDPATGKPNHDIQ